MREHRFNVFPWATLLVDLTCPDDELLRAADRSVRKNLKNALAAGCKVSILQEPDQVKARYLPACSAIEAALGKPAPCVRVADIVLAEDKARWYRHAVAESAAGEPLATLGMYCFNGVATEIASVLSPLALERKIPAQDLLHWEMLLAAKRAGCHTFDLAGVNPDPQTPKEAGIRRFKEKWGGKYREYDTFSRELGWRELVGRFRQRVQAMRDLMRPKRPHA